ncbi:MAG: hypothetical protein CVV44_02785 [Spirochaetae bacterium HGW-Spirochaetae-1]|jgi:hypothetical protein|nr:MAG: hypothetical protein CVV44_02785 [Spirochaetae bacterium HGW-Spirochaetae-1]
MKGIDIYAGGRTSFLPSFYLPSTDLTQALSLTSGTMPHNLHNPIKINLIFSIFFKKLLNPRQGGAY